MKINYSFCINFIKNHNIHPEYKMMSNAVKIPDMVFKIMLHHPEALYFMTITKWLYILPYYVIIAI